MDETQSWAHVDWTKYVYYCLFLIFIPFCLQLFGGRCWNVQWGVASVRNIKLTETKANTALKTICFKYYICVT